MNTRFIAITCLLIVLFLSTEGKRAKRTFRGNLHKNKKNIMLADDPLISVEAFGPRTMIGTCSCTCCEPELAPLTNPVCPNDVIVAVDSSACFRDHHRRMINFLEKLVQEFHKSDNVKFGADKTRLGIMQFSSDIVHAIKLSDFDYYRSPSGSKYLRDDIKDIVRKLEFLGEGAYLNKALNETAAAFARYPRPREILRANAVAPRKVVILLTNGKSHPSVGLTDIEQSISLLKEMGILVYPVSVTRQCVGMSSAEWDEGLCPDTVVLDALANVGNKKEDEFFTMRSGVQEELVKSISNCDPFGNLEASAPCNNCSCDCELPIGPPGPIGPRGPKGDFVQGDPGDQGFPGIDGEPGDVGPLGPPGNQGEKGNIGQPGPQGERGLPGEVGPQGGEGEKGDVGPRGPEGEVGEKGDVGPRGPLGPEGDRGPPGPEGDIGEKGDKGGYGDEGPRGPQGPKGEPGIGIKGGPGPRGPPGPKGMVGVPGVPGKTGDKGEHGLCGKPGPAGKSGEIGLPGIDGYDGSAGPPGTQGPRGPEGPQGSRGENGTPGREGDPGSIGLPGSTGPRGTIGPAGPQGQKGEPSNERGPRGDPGADGSKGARGSPGRDGLDGREGPGGEQGPRGDPGFPGPAGTINLEELRPIISEIVRELLPAECVEPPSNIEECKEYPIDLVFLVDGSDSIDREDFSRVKEWILSTVDSFGANGENRKTQLHVDVVQYSEKVQIEVHSFIQSSSDEIRNQVDGIEQMRSGTKTYSGLRFVNEQVSRNIRPGSYKILITLTDGDASEDRDPGAIAEAKSFYNIMVGVGVGDKVVSEELKDFAHGGRVVTVNDFAALEGIVSQIVSDSCREIGQEVARQEASRSQPVTITRRVRHAHKKPGKTTHQEEE